MGRIRREKSHDATGDDLCEREAACAAAPHLVLRFSVATSSLLAAS
jgi:hypothetical protein